MEHVTRGASGDDAVTVGIELRYWAGAADAAGCESERLEVAAPRGESDGSAVTGRDVRAAIVTAHPGIDAVLRRCTLLHDGRRIDDDALVAPEKHVEVLPPFVGG